MTTSPKQKPVKIKDLAEKYKVTPKQVLHELASEGVEVEPGMSAVPGDIFELVEEHFEKVFGAKKAPATRKEKGESAGAKNAKGDAPAAPAGKEVHIKTPIIVKNLADALGKKPNEVIQTLIKNNVLASVNQTVSPEIATLVAESFGFTLLINKRDLTAHTETVEPVQEKKPAPRKEHLRPRPPVVTFLGHVDHGKTSLQDRVRKTHVVTGESGGITQHIGASTVSFNGQPITFIDTPGHAAFTAMRARGANVTDIAILVVAANDGFMPQTIEALSHIKAAKVPIIVAANKMDLPQADLDKVLRGMQTHGLLSEQWGGDVGVIPVSALTGMGMDNLLERILLEAEMLELRADPGLPAEGVVIESQLEQGLGPTASILIQSGTLKVGDPILCGQFSGKVRSLIDDKGKRIKSAGPSIPVKVIGLDGVPDAGQKMMVCKSERDARVRAEDVADSNRDKALSNVRGTSLEDLFDQIKDEKKNDLHLILKTDVKGSAEAIADALHKLPSEKIAVEIVHDGVGAITENDVLLAAASHAIVVGFHVRVNNGVNALAKREGVQIRLYSIIYQLIEDITEALIGQLEPDKREIQQGTGKILKIFEVSKGTPICGSMVETGFVKVGSKVRVYRNKELIFNGEVKSLRRFQDDVKEVKQGLECGIRLDNFKDLEENDLLQFYEVKSEKATL